MSELIDGYVAMPLWAQVGVGWFVLMVIVMLATPSFEYRRHRGRLERLARELGTTVTRGSERWPLSFSVEVDGRRFELRYDHMSGRRELGQRPDGHVLFTSTALSGGGWAQHEVDIIPGRIPRWLRSKNLPAGAHDSPFQVSSSGVPVRHGWFDSSCRAAVTAFYAFDREVGPIEVRGGTLTHWTSVPWPARDGAQLRELLRRQAAVAMAFERSASQSE